MTTKTQHIGRRGEDIAAHHLESQGMTLLDRNWRTTCGEIDIVARDGPELVVVEVKTRTDHRAGHPLEAVTPDKLARLQLLALAYRQAHPGSARRIRIDAVGVTAGSPDGEPTIEHLRGVTS